MTTTVAATVILLKLRMLGFLVPRLKAAAVSLAFATPSHRDIGRFVERVGLGNLRIRSCRLGRHHCSGRRFLRTGVRVGTGHSFRAVRVLSCVGRFSSIAVSAVEWGELKKGG